MRFENVRPALVCKPPRLAVGPSLESTMAALGNGRLTFEHGWLHLRRDERVVK
jgi:hypothetical protein